MVNPSPSYNKNNNNNTMTTPYSILQKLPFSTIKSYDPTDLYKEIPNLSKTPYRSLTELTLSGGVPIRATQQTLDAWLNEASNLIQDINSLGIKEKKIYEEWCEKDGVKRIAPGFEIGLNGQTTILRPSVKGASNSSNDNRNNNNSKEKINLEKTTREDHQILVDKHDNDEDDGNKNKEFNEIDNAFKNLKFK